MSFLKFLKTITEIVFVSIHSIDVQTNRASIRTPTMEDGFFWLSRPIRFAVKQQYCSVTYRLAYVALNDMFLLNWSEVLQYKATAHTGRMDLNTRVGSAVTKRCTFLLFQYLRIIKLTKNNKISKKKKSQLALPTNSCSSLRNPNPVEFPLVVSTTVFGSISVYCYLRQASLVMQLPEFSWLWANVIFIHNFPAFM